jgi:hypothetical protein
MARADDYTEADKPKANGTALAKVHTRAIKRFQSASAPQMEIRAHALTCRRFISIPGAMWEGAWGEQFCNSIRVEIDKLSKGVDKIVTDYRENRIVPDFRPSGGDSDQDTADTLDGVHRADDYQYKAQQARDNTFEEAAAGGFGAYRLCNELADPSDKDNDAQRINPALIIVDADQRVFFDPNSKLYDKSDADWAFVLTADSREAFEEAYPNKLSNWPEGRLLRLNYEWFMPDVVIKAEYYEVENNDEDLLIFTHALSGEQQREWADEIDAADIKDLKAQGWKQQTVKRSRKRVHKYVMSGADVLEDNGYIAGTEIPIVPVYGKRWFVDNQERFRGYVSKRMDAQRIYNAKVSKLSETDALAPREKPIFDPEQLPPALQTMWAQQEQMRHPYALANALRNPDGSIASLGPIGKIEPPQVAPVTAILLQAAAADLTEESEDGADEVKANTSAEAMDIAATRVDAKSAIYLDNMRQSVQREGEIYLSMARDVYYEPGRVIETMDEDGGDGEATLHEPYTDSKGTFGIRNDFSSGKYKVIADVTEATSTRREKTVKSMLNIAEVAVQAQDLEGAQAAIITATLNMDGEGLDDYQKWNRKRAIKLGLVQPNDEEKAELEQEMQPPQPDPVAQAKIEDMTAAAGLKTAKAGEAKASTILKVAQAHAVAGPAEEPDTPDGLKDEDEDSKWANIRKTDAETQQIQTETSHLPHKLAIEALNAQTNQLKANAQQLSKRSAGK